MLLFLKNKSRFSLTKIVLSLGLVILSVWPAWGNMEAAPHAVDVHLQGIASFTKPSPMVPILAGWFLMGTNRDDLNRHSFETQYDNTEFPQRRIWLDAFQIDQYEVSLGEFLQFLQGNDRMVSPELRNLMWHLISIHFIPDQALAPWPALYVTWAEAQAFCLNQGKRLPSEAEWEKAARGIAGKIFPWGAQDPSQDIAVSERIMCMKFPLWPTWIVFRKAKVSGIFIICRAISLNGRMIGWGRIITLSCLNEIRQVLNQDATNRYVEDHGKASPSCFVPPLEEAPFPKSDQPTSASAVQSL